MMGLVTGWLGGFDTTLVLFKWGENPMHNKNNCFEDDSVVAASNDRLKDSCLMANYEVSFHLKLP